MTISWPSIRFYAVHAWVLMTLVTTNAAFAATPYFTAGQMGACLVREIHTGMGKERFLERLKETEEHAKNLRAFQFKETRKILDPAWNLRNPWTQLRLTFRMTHSTPLIPFDPRLLKSQTGITTALRNLQQDANFNLVDHPDLTEILRFKSKEIPPVRSLDLEQLADEYYVHSPIGDPLTAAMLGHSRKSLSHWNTIQLSLASYKSDLLLALGVIGVLMEMDADAWPRKERSVLNSKVKDLFADDDIDPAGYNYHFYGHLNMTLQGFGAMLRTTSAFEEADDPGDHAADLLGVDTGEYVLKNLNGPTPKCELP